MKSRLQSLISKLCPNGVQYRHLWEVTFWDKSFNEVENHKQPKVIKYKYFLAADLKLFATDNGDIKLLTTNNSDLWTTQEISGEVPSEDEIIAIPWGGNPIVQYYKGKFLTADNRIAIAREKSEVNMKFLYYVLSEDLDTIAKYYRGSGIKHPSMSKVLDLRIPLPPLAIQEEIVEFLDNFIQIDAELSAELESRKTQYNFYRNHLLSFRESEAGVRWLRIGDLLRLQAGKFVNATEIHQEVDSNFIFPCYGGNGIRGFVSSFSHEGEYVLIGRQGALSGNVKRTVGRFYATEHAIVVTPKEECDTSWLYHTLLEMNLNQYVSRGAQPGLAVGNLDQLEIAVPSLEEQRRIGSILDAFDKLLHDDYVGIPAEIIARRRQYEYFRSKLLDFKELEVA